MQRPIKKSRFTRRTNAYKALQRLFQTDVINGTESYTDVQPMNTEFSRFGVEQFRNAYNRYKLDFMKNNESGDTPLTQLGNRSTEDNHSIGANCTGKPRTSSEDKKPQFIVNDDENDSASNLSEGDNYWAPLFLISQWIQPETTQRRLSVAIVLPSGVLDTGFKLEVSENGLYLKVTVVWPGVLTSMDVLHKLFLRNTTEYNLQEIHLSMNGFEAGLRDLRASKIENISSTCTIALPFTVIAETRYNLLGWHNDATRVLFVWLRARTERYGVTNNMQSVEIV